MKKRDRLHGRGGAREGSGRKCTRPGEKLTIKAFRLGSLEISLIDSYAKRKGIGASDALRKILAEWMNFKDMETRARIRACLLAGNLVPITPTAKFRLPQAA